jgi:hypothetical protein
MGAPATSSDAGDIRRILRSRRVQERFLHLAHYEGRSPAQGILLGLELTAAARRALRERS